MIGIILLPLYNHYAFHSWTHLAYDNVKNQERGFFGIAAPEPEGVLDAAVRLPRPADDLSGADHGRHRDVMLYRRARRAEALTIAAIALCYLTYNSGYYLPFGGASWARAS